MAIAANCPLHLTWDLSLSGRLRQNHSRSFSGPYSFSSLTGSNPFSKTLKQLRPLNYTSRVVLKIEGGEGLFLGGVLRTDEGGSWEGVRGGTLGLGLEPTYGRSIIPSTDVATVNSCCLSSRCTPTTHKGRIWYIEISSKKYLRKHKGSS